MGGAGTLFGPLLGALIWLYLFEVLPFVDAVGPYWRLILGVIFVILVTVFRRGICGEFIAWRDKRRKRRIARAHTSITRVPLVTGWQPVSRTSFVAGLACPRFYANNIVNINVDHN